VPERGRIVFHGVELRPQGMNAAFGIEVGLRTRLRDTSQPRTKSHGKAKIPGLSSAPQCFHVAQTDRNQLACIWPLTHAGNVSHIHEIEESTIAVETPILWDGAKMG
jgi:hypothetical protein